MLNIVGSGISGYGRLLLSVTIRLVVFSTYVEPPMKNVGRGTR